MSLKVFLVSLAVTILGGTIVVVLQLGLLEPLLGGPIEGPSPATEAPPQVVQVEKFTVDYYGSEAPAIRKSAVLKDPSDLATPLPTYTAYTRLVSRADKPVKITLEFSPQGFLGASLDYKGQSKRTLDMGQNEIVLYPEQATNIMAYWKNAGYHSSEDIYLHPSTEVQFETSGTRCTFHPYLSKVCSSPDK